MEQANTRGLVVATTQPHFAELATEAARRMVEFLSVPVDLVFLPALPGREAARAKLEAVAARTPTENVILCDADLWFMRKPTRREIPRGLGPGRIAAVKDFAPDHPGGFTFHDFDRFDLDTSRAVNSGLIYAGKGTGHVFTRALDWLAENESLLKDWGEQTAFNAALQMKQPRSFQFIELPTAWNWSPVAAANKEQPRIDPLGVHAAAIPATEGDRRPKLEALRFYAAKTANPNLS